MSLAACVSASTTFLMVYRSLGFPRSRRDERDGAVCAVGFHMGRPVCAVYGYRPLVRSTASVSLMVPAGKASGGPTSCPPTRQRPVARPGAERERPGPIGVRPPPGKHGLTVKIDAIRVRVGAGRCPAPTRPARPRRVSRGRAGAGARRLGLCARKCRVRTLSRRGRDGSMMGGHDRGRRAAAPDHRSGRPAGGAKGLGLKRRGRAHAV
jgi:hypothetical protein